MDIKDNTWSNDCPNFHMFNRTCLKFVHFTCLFLFNVTFYKRILHLGTNKLNSRQSNTLSIHNCSLKSTLCNLPPYAPTSVEQMPIPGQRDRLTLAYILKLCDAIGALGAERQRKPSHWWLCVFSVTPKRINMHLLY